MLMSVSMRAASNWLHKRKKLKQKQGALFTLLAEKKFLSALKKSRLLPFGADKRQRERIKSKSLKAIHDPKAENLTPKQQQH